MPKLKLISLTLFAGILTACGAAEPPATAIATTRVPLATEVSAAQPTAAPATDTQQPDVSEAPSATTIPPTITPTPTLPPIPTDTPLPTTDYTATPEACDAAEFVEAIYLDVPVKEGTQVHPGQKFSISWRAKNIGHCVWVTEYQIVVVEQSGLTQHEETVAFPTFAVPGQEIDLTYPITAPQSGSVSIQFMLRNAEGQLFGFGEAAEPHTFNFSVVNLPANWRYDFIAARCQAQWSSFYVVYLPCEGSALSWYDGYVYYDPAPSLESKTANNPPVLITKANNQLEQYIQGRYPLYTVQQGDVFKAKIGCMDEMFGCSVKFSLYYQDASGAVFIIHEWVESYDGKRPDISADLSYLAGQEIHLILGVMQDDVHKRTRQSMGFWMAPHIENNN